MPRKKNSIPSFFCQIFNFIEIDKDGGHIWWRNRPQHCIASAPLVMGSQVFPLRFNSSWDRKWLTGQKKLGFYFRVNLIYYIFLTIEMVILDSF